LKCLPSPPDVWLWSGKQDNEKIEKLLASVESPVLLWTDISPLVNSRDFYSNRLNCTCIIIDGTFQEAKAMFRRGPDLLRSIPRITLRPSSSSTYSLRKNFGFRQRFALADKDAIDDGLLCTVEVAAELYDLASMRDESQALRLELHKFQIQYKSGQNGI
jgi:DTW domain-containing protein YfiP